MNTDLILAILDKFSAGETAELIFRDEGLELTLRKESALRSVPAAAPVPRQDPSSPKTVPGTVPEAGAVPPFPPVHLGLPSSRAAETGGDRGETIASPIVAVFYPSPQPGAPAFVSSGSRVKTGDTLCILEAMKMMNHLEAEFDCEILRVLPSGGDMVEYGQPLFEVKRL
ncbi:MAG: acetyl-CoA carboxylase biotin carboxyl carrier protein subunit [Spirochaetaceae bacterium]|jgi:acetyl-CoA carboxylase biotin carboxyl carrier protein|nr:acetyl-CoA carboxylase biotin carboxyl carrier protein subunit [Spirochaetaceae bacterium]